MQTAMPRKYRPLCGAPAEALGKHRECETTKTGGQRQEPRAERGQARRFRSAMSRELGQGHDGGRLVHHGGPQPDDGHRHQAGIQQGATPIVRRKKLCQKSLARRGLRGLHPTIGFSDPGQHVERQQHGSAAAQEHGAPTIVRTHRVVERGRKKEADVVAGAEVARTHFAARLRPRLRHISAGHGPLAADPHTRQKTKRTQLPHVLRKGGRRVNTA